MAWSLPLHLLPGEGSCLTLGSSPLGPVTLLGAIQGGGNSWHLAGCGTEFLWCVEHELHCVALGKLKMGLGNKDAKLPGPLMALFETEPCTGYVVNKWHACQCCHCNLLPGGGFGGVWVKVGS